MTIGGNVTVKNAIEWDYCLEQCVRSLVPICSTINLVDSDSTDGTKDLLNKLAEEFPQVNLLNYSWTEKPGDVDCILRKMNWSRERLTTDFHLHLEADEVLGQESYEWILNEVHQPGKVIVMKRLNFWNDPQHVLSPGRILSPFVIRLAPTSYFLGGDAPHPMATQTEPNADWRGVQHCNIYHYGFLRRTEAYAKKYSNLMININGSDRADPSTMDLLEHCAKTNANWMEKLSIPSEPFNGDHPKEMREWLANRGYTL